MKTLRIVFVILLFYGLIINISFAKTPKRIISANPIFTDILYSLGSEKEVVGVTKYCKKPIEAQKKPKIGDMFLNYETILKLKPDLVIVMPAGNGDNVKKLKSLGLNVLSLRCDTIEDFKNCTLKIGKAIGRDKKASELIFNLERDFEKVKNLSNNIEKSKRKKVFVEIWDSPLMTCGKNSYISQLIEIAGGVNIGNSVDSANFNVGTEFLYKFNPDVIFLMTSEKPQPAWKRLKAVKNNTVYRLEPDSFAVMSFDMGKLTLDIHNKIYGNKNYK